MGCSFTVASWGYGHWNPKGAVYGSNHIHFFAYKTLVWFCLFLSSSASSQNRITDCIFRLPLTITVMRMMKPINKTYLKLELLYYFNNYFIIINMRSCCKPFYLSIYLFILWCFPTFCPKLQSQYPEWLVEITLVFVHTYCMSSKLLCTWYQNELSNKKDTTEIGKKSHGVALTNTTDICLAFWKGS